MNTYHTTIAQKIVSGEWTVAFGSHKNALCKMNFYLFYDSLY